MPISVQWDNQEQTIIRYEFVDSWTWAEMYTAVDEMNTLLDSVSHRVDFIAHFRDGVIKVPPGTLVHARKLAAKHHPRAGFTVIVGGNELIRALYAMIMRLYGRVVTLDIRFAGTVDEARTIIAKYPS